MSEEEMVVKSEAAAKPAKEKKKKRKNPITKWFRELRSELKKVVWPSRKQIINNTLVALVLIVASAIVVWAFDQLAAQGINALISIGG